MTARPRSVYVVCAEVPPDVVGGLGRYAERMMAAMADLGTPVEVFGATTHKTPRTERLGDVTLHRVRIPGGGLTRAPAAVLNVARMVGILVFNVRVASRIIRAGAGRSGSVVAVHDWMGCVAGILCRLLVGTPVVFHVHTRELNAAPSRSGSSRNSPSSGRTAVAAVIAALETAQARLARLIVVPSAGMRDDLVACGWPPDRLRVIPHGFEAPELLRLTGLTGDERDRLRAEVRRRYLPDGDGRLVVYAGRLSPHKGVHTLIHAAPLIAKERDDVRIVLLGAQAPRTDENAQVARLIDETGVGRHVSAGYRFLSSAEVFAHFLAADVCVFPSTYEPFGLVAIEAMALSRPVVVGPGYSPEVAGDGAVRYDHDSPEELADALLRCLADPQAASRLGERAAAHVRARYSWARTAELTLAAYAEPPGT